MAAPQESIFSDAVALTGQDQGGSSWNCLAAATSQPDPFCSTTMWQLAFREAIDPERHFVLRQSENGIIQFARHRTAAGLFVLGPIERLWLFGCNVLGPEGPQLLDGFLHDLTTSPENLLPGVIVSGIEPNGALASALRHAFSDRYRLNVFRDEVQCAASLDGGLDGFLARRSAGHRRNIRRYDRRAREAGVRFERISPAPENARDVYERMLAVERASWKGIGNCGMDEPDMRAFYWAMLRRLSQVGAARVILAVRDGLDIGYIFGGVHRGIYRGQQFSFDEAYAGMSLGNLLQIEQIRWLCEERAERYDMGPLQGAAMAYKHHWTEIELPIEAWLISLP